MESAEQERRQFTKVAAVLGSSEQEITSPGILSLETIQEVTICEIIVYLQSDSILTIFYFIIGFFRQKRKLKG
jgi:hypothetical protein